MIDADRLPVAALMSRGGFVMGPSRKGARALATVVVVTVGLIVAGSAFAQAPPKQPNILVIWGDDIGVHNISAYNLGIMGYRTPNIDSIARDGALFTDAYGEQSCTAGRA